LSIVRTLLTPGLFGVEQAIEEQVRGQLGPDGLRQQRFQRRGGVAAPERGQLVARRVDVEPHPRRRHRATSASRA
jgi:hypothetical protein